MKFEFDTVIDGPKEAAALVSALTVLHGDAVSDVLDAAVAQLSGNTVSAPKAADGHPFNVADHAGRKSENIIDEATHFLNEQTDTSAADAFGGGAPLPDTAPPVRDPSAALDSAGIPWHEKIHASTKTTNKDGTWSRRRNTPDDVYNSVMAELKGGAPVVPPAPTTAPPPPSANADVTSAPVVPPPPATTTPVSFPKLLVKITQAKGAQKITTDAVLEILSEFGLTAEKEMAQASPDILEAISALVDAKING